MVNLSIIIGIAAVVLILTIIGILTRYKKCPSDKILVIHGKTSGNKTAKCIHGGAAFVVPVVQGYSYMSLEPLQFNCNLDKALSAQNIRVDVPTVVTVGISTDPTIMQNAAERILGLSSSAIELLVKDIVHGQLRLIVSNLTIEQLNADRDKLMTSVSHMIDTELNKIGLKLINLNIVDIKDEAGYIVALGQKDKAIAINQANVEKATAEKDGEIKIAEQLKEKNSRVAETKKDETIAIAIANAEKESQVAETNKNKDVNVAQANAEKDAMIAERDRDRDISIANSKAEAQLGQIEADKRIVDQEAKLKIVESNALRDSEVAAAVAHANIQEETQKAQVKVEQAKAKVQQEKELAQVQVVKAQGQVKVEKEIANKLAEESRAEADKATMYANNIVPAEIQKQETIIKADAFKKDLEIKAEAEANSIKLKAQGDADAEILKGEGEAKAISAKGLAEAEVIKQKGLAEAEAERASLEAQAEGFKSMINASETNPQLAIQFKMVQEGTYERIAAEGSAAFKEMNFGNIQIMDTSKGGSLTNVMSNLISQVSPVLNVVKDMDIPGITSKIKGNVITEKSQDVNFEEVE